MQRRLTRTPDRHRPARDVRPEPDVLVKPRLAHVQAGTPLETAQRTALEDRLGHQLSHVRIHADATADRLAGDLDARAFAVGEEIFFRAGEFDPATPSGLRLLAHESAHTLQQRGVDLESATEPLDVPNVPQLEHEAARTAEAAVDASIAPPSTLTHTAAAQVQRWPWDDDDSSSAGASTWDSIVSGASTVADYAASGATAAYEGYQKSTDFHGLAGEMNKGIDWAEGQSAAGNQKMVDDAKGIPVLEQLAQGSAWLNNATTNVTGGLLKGAGDLAAGLVNPLAHPLDAAGGMVSLLEHTGTGIPFVGTTLKAGHGLYDLAVNGGGQYGNSFGQLANHLFNPLQQQEDDAAYLSTAGKQIIAPGKENEGGGWQRWKDNPFEAATRAAVNVAPFVMGMGEMMGPGAAGEAGAVAAASEGTVNPLARSVAPPAGGGVVSPMAKSIPPGGPRATVPMSGAPTVPAPTIPGMPRPTLPGLGPEIPPGVIEPVPAPRAVPEAPGIPKNFRKRLAPGQTPENLGLPTTATGSLNEAELLAQQRARRFQAEYDAKPPLAKTRNVETMPAEQGLPTNPDGSLDLAELIRRYGRM